MVERVNIVKAAEDDEHFRYKMEKMVIKWEGRGGNSKTVVINIDNVAKDLNTLPQYIIKYFGLILGTQSSYDKVLKRGSVSGHIDHSEIYDLLYQFIEKFILCKHCKYPELVMQITKNQQIVCTCQACGGDTKIFGKLNKFILSNPPPKITIKPKKQQQQQQQQQQEEQQKNEKQQNEKEQKKNQNEKEKSSFFQQNIITDQNTENLEDWGADLSKEAIEQRKKDLEITGSFSENKEEKQQEVEEDVNPIQVLLIFSNLENINEGDIITAIKEMKKIYQLNEKKICSLMCEAFFGPEKTDLLKQSKRKINVFSNFVKKDSTQKHLLGYLENYLQKKKNLPNASLILELFYDNKVLDEPIILDWFKKKKSKMVKKPILLSKIKESAKPFITWLEKAQEE